MTRLAEIAGQLEQLAEDDSAGDALREIADELRTLVGEPAAQASDVTQEERIDAIYQLTLDTWHREGEIEVDEITAADISEGDDNGTYVRVWAWVSFAGTVLDKDDDEDEDDEPDEAEA